MKLTLITQKMLLPNFRKLKLLSTRTRPTSAVVTSVSLEKETAKKATAARNAYLEKAAHRMKSTEMLQGEVILKVVR